MLPIVSSDLWAFEPLASWVSEVSLSWISSSSVETSGVGSTGAEVLPSVGISTCGYNGSNECRGGQVYC